MNMLRKCAIGCVLAGMAIVGGCSTVPQGDYDAAVAEATELRERVAMLQQQLDDCETRSAALSEENARLAAGTGSQRTGFEGMGEVSMRGGDIVVTVAGDVLFDSGQITLKNDAKTRLNRIAQVIKSQYPGHTIRVEGYTDTDPIRKSKWGTNERLSGERAMAVRDFLVSSGVPSSRIYFAGFGPNHQKATKAASRRVEIVVLADTR